MGFEITQKVFAICQLEEVLISLEKISVFRLYGILKEHPYRRQNKKSRQSSSGLNPSQYKTSKYFSDLQIFIASSSKNSVR